MVPQYESATNGKFQKQNGLKGLQMVQFECPRCCNLQQASIFTNSYAHFFKRRLASRCASKPSHHRKCPIIKGSVMMKLTLRTRRSRNVIKFNSFIHDECGLIPKSSRWLFLPMSVYRSATKWGILVAPVTTVTASIAFLPRRDALTIGAGKASEIYILTVGPAYLKKKS